MTTKNKATITHTHRVSIRTRYYGATNYRGSRIYAWRADESSAVNDPMAVRMPYRYELSVSDVHQAAIELYITGHNAAGHDWTGTWIMGAMEDGYVAVWQGRGE